MGLAFGRSLECLSAADRLAWLRRAEEAKIQISAQGFTALLSGEGSSPLDGRHKQGPTPFQEGRASHASAGQAPNSFSVLEIDQAWGPLLARLWPPLRRLAVRTRLQFRGCLPQLATDLEKLLAQEALPGQGANVKGKTQDWGYQMFAQGDSGRGTASSSKWVAPPRTATGLVMVGAATRMPFVREFVTEVNAQAWSCQRLPITLQVGYVAFLLHLCLQLTGLLPAEGVNPEDVVALGAALQVC